MQKGGNLGGPGKLVNYQKKKKKTPETEQGRALQSDASAPESPDSPK
jgi:hypothetical protein